MWYTASIIVYEVGANCISVPYTSLTPDLSNSYDQGTQLSEVKAIAAMVFVVICTTSHAFIIEAFPNLDTYDPNYTLGYAISSYIFGTLFFFPTSYSYYWNNREAKKFTADTS